MGQDKYHDKMRKLTGDIGGLDKVLELLDLLLELGGRDLGILNDQGDLEHLDTWD